MEEPSIFCGSKHFLLGVQSCHHLSLLPACRGTWHSGEWLRANLSWPCATPFWLYLHLFEPQLSTCKLRTVITTAASDCQGRSSQSVASQRSPRAGGQRGSRLRGERPAVLSCAEKSVPAREPRPAGGLDQGTDSGPVLRRNFLQTGVDLQQRGFSQERMGYLAHEVLRSGPDKYSLGDLQREHTEQIKG